MKIKEIKKTLARINTIIKNEKHAQKNIKRKSS